MLVKNQVTANREKSAKDPRKKPTYDDLISAITDRQSIGQLNSLLGAKKSTMQVSIAPLMTAEREPVLSSEGSIAILSTSENFNKLPKPQYIIKATKAIEKYQATLKRLNEDGKTHPNLIKIFTILNPDKDTALHLTPFHPIDLHELMNAYKNSRQFYLPSIIIKALKEVKNGLDHLHEIRVIHNDIKPENLLVTIEHGLKIIITDFGLSQTYNKKTADDNKVTWVVSGTPRYYSPIHIKIFAILYGLVTDTENTLSSSSKVGLTLSYATIKAIDLFCLFQVIAAIQGDFSWQDNASLFNTFLSTQLNIEEAKKYYYKLHKHSLWTLDPIQMNLDSKSIEEKIANAISKYRQTAEQEHNNISELANLITTYKLRPDGSKCFTLDKANVSNNGPAEANKPQRRAAGPLAPPLERLAFTGSLLNYTTRRLDDRHAASSQPPIAHRPASQTNVPQCSCICM